MAELPTQRLEKMKRLERAPTIACKREQTRLIYSLFSCPTLVPNVAPSNPKMTVEKSVYLARNLFGYLT